MINIFAFLLLVCSAWANPLLRTNTNNGKVALNEPNANDISDNRIINGRTASPGQFPYQAAITISTNLGSTFCGGALISDQWVLTAAHCIQKVVSLNVMLGSISRNGNEDTKITVGVSNYVVHPAYSSSTNRNDIALLKLQNPVEFNEKIKPLALPSENDTIADGVTLTVSGFGATSDNTATSTILRFVQVHSISEASCRAVYGSNIWKGQICTQGNTIEATCEGDSGGPLVRGEGDERVSVGVVSFGTNTCIKGYPNGFSRTAYYRAWIKEVTEI